ncbi:MAG: hypothetical protein K0R64_3555 [Novosphingobium lindaniclasticum]|jgi:putative SOS response-associated peptidase YedK|uniref:SOS response-associated peptidase family protein n=1 Tax=Novosphingobium lindaniclasticum TaxID=1329895 RepID=UPI00240950EE|nr:SOS response-associated peptidase family protein [Novosphingobium lindaniclasticum]MDF2640571.1 hypothetical protein [Novosphingobium lindaniclasticum]
MPSPIPVDGFYEFTAPANPKQKRKDKWRFTALGPAGFADGPGSPQSITLRGSHWFCIAGLWRADPKVGEAFTLLTIEPGSDIAPYHSRQVVVLASADWPRWLDGSAPSSELCRPAPAGTFRVERVA